MKKTIEERRAYAKVIAQTWMDQEFKKRLLDDPATVLKQNGIEIPEGMTVRFIESHENEILMQLPPRPAGSEQLSDKQLQHVSGGSIGAYDEVIY